MQHILMVTTGIYLFCKGGCVRDEAQEPGDGVHFNKTVTPRTATTKVLNIDSYRNLTKCQIVFLY